MKILKNLLSSDYGMLGVLVFLCVFFSVITYEEQQPLGKDGAERLFAKISNDFEESGTVIIAGKNSNDGQKFVLHLENELKRAGWEVAAAISGSPVDIGKALRRTVEKKQKVNVFACEQTLAGLPVVENLKKSNPLLQEMKVLSPQSYGWPNFLKTSNLLNVANQIAVIAIIAIGMTLVIITAGIDLSVGSLIAFSAVLCCWFMKEWMGGPDASVMGMIIAALFAVLGCGIVGLFSGSMVAYFGVPSFVASLGMMMVASGFAYMISGGLSIYQIPPSFDWLGRGEAFWGIPNAVVLMVLLYVYAKFVMRRTTALRYIYPVGGNPEAARLSGVPVKKILLWVYTVSGALAGLGGVVMASQFLCGDPIYLLIYLFYVFASVVVGGTSLAGGRGKVFGTLIGAFIIAVIQNGMNLTGVQSYTQKVVLGIVLLSAVLLDMIKKKGWKLSS